MPYGIENSEAGAHRPGLRTEVRWKDPMTHSLTKPGMMPFVPIIVLRALSERAVPEGLMLIRSGTAGVMLSAAAPGGRDGKRTRCLTDRVPAPVGTHLPDGMPRMYMFTSSCILRSSCIPSILPS